MTTADMFRVLALSLGLGLLVGLQRERTEAMLAGFRTFPLISMFGSLMGILAVVLGQHNAELLNGSGAGAGAGGVGVEAAPHVVIGVVGAVIIAAGLLGVGVVLIAGNVRDVTRDHPRTGITSEITALAMYGLGVFLVFGPAPVGVVIGGVIALLLQAKPLLHGLAAKLGDKDMHGIMQFVLIALVILPLIPDRPLVDPPAVLSVVNPRNVWLMVVLVVGISLAAYLVHKFWAAGRGSAGLVITGVLGGLVSSTATTVSAARRARAGGGEKTHGDRGAAQSGMAAAAAAVIILTAGAVVYGRVVIEIGAVSRELLRDAAAPIAVSAGWSVLLAGVMWQAGRRAARRNGGDGCEIPAPENPTELKSALFIAALYAVVLVIAALATRELGQSAIYGVAAVSGLTDMDAITLSSARLVSKGQIAAETAWRAILIAIASNTAFKGAIAAWLGGPALRKRLLPVMGAIIAANLAIAWLWP